AASPVRRRAQTWRSLFVALCAALRERPVATRATGSPASRAALRHEERHASWRVRGGRVQKKSRSALPASPSCLNSLRGVAGYGTRVITPHAILGPPGAFATGGCALYWSGNP